MEKIISRNVRFSVIQQDESRDCHAHTKKNDTNNHFNRRITRPSRDDVQVNYTVYGQVLKKLFMQANIQTASTLTTYPIFSQLVCHWGLAVWSPASWAVSGVARWAPCGSVCRSTGKAQGSTLLSHCWTFWTCSASTAKLMSILFSCESCHAWSSLFVCWFGCLPSLTASHKRRQSQCPRMAHANSCRAGGGGLWAVAKGVLPPSGCAHCGRAGGHRPEYCKLKCIQLVTRGKGKKKSTVLNSCFHTFHRKMNEWMK